MVWVRPLDSIQVVDPTTCGPVLDKKALVGEVGAGDARAEGIRIEVGDYLRDDAVGE